MKSFFYQQLNEELLVEKRLQDVYKEKLKNTVNGDLLYKQIVKADPTAQGNEGNESGDYINWIARILIRDYLEKYKQIPVLDVIGNNLKKFEQYKQWWRRNKAQVQKEEEAENAIQRQINPDLLVQKMPSFDINAYKNFSELAMNLETIYDFIKHYGYSTENKEAKKEAEKLKTDPKHSRVLFNNEDYTLVEPLSHKSNCAWGVNTKWCTTERDSYHHDRYQNLSPLYVLLDKKNNKRYQFNVATGQYANELDHMMSSQELHELLSKLPNELKMKLKEMAEEGSKCIDSIASAHDDQLEDVDNLQSQLDKIDEDIDEKEIEKEKLEDEIKELEYQLENTDEEEEDERDQIEQELMDKKSYLDDIETELDRLQKHRDIIDDEKTDAERGEFQYNDNEYDPQEIDMDKRELKKFVKALDLTPEQEKGFHW